MPNLKKTLISGNELEISMASFSESHKLLKAVMREIEKVPVSLGASNEVIDTLKNILTRVVGSDSVEEALWPCMQRATWNGRKINRDIFEDEGPRGDFLEIAKEVLWFNLNPFTQSLTSLLSVNRLAK